MKWYQFNIQNMTDDEYNCAYSLMRKEKQHRVDRFRFQDDKKRTVAGEMLARKAISEKCNVKPEEIVFATEKQGKPFAEGISIHFNISHSEDFVVCAVSDTPVGIDIEKIRPVNLKTAKKFCNEDELLYIFGYMPAEEDLTETTDIDLLTRFFEIWTKKEAYGKCIGEGLCFETPENNHKFDVFYDIDGYIVTLCSRQ